METQPDVKGTLPQSSPPSVRNSIQGAEDVVEKPVEAEPVYLAGRSLLMLVVGLLLVVLVITLDISILATAIPYITDDFHTIKDIGWYASAYSFTNASLQPLSGKFYTYFSVKWVFMICIAIFEVGSLVCATAPTSTALVVGRAVAGIGGSGIINGALSIVGLAVEPAKRPMLMGIIMSFASCGQIVGPLIGGALTEKVTWRWCFYLNLPVGGVTLLFLFFIAFPENKQQRKDNKFRSIIGDFDVLGFALFAPGMIMLLLALQWGGTTYAWTSSTIIGLFVGAGVTLAIFVAWELRAQDKAMFPASLIKRRPVYSSILTAFLQGGSLLLLSYYLPIWFQSVHNRSPIGSAVDTLPSFIAQVLFAVMLGIAIPRVGYMTPFAIAGSIISTIGLTLMAALFSPTTKAGEWIGFQILIGAGRGMIMQIPTQTIQASIPRAQISVGTAVGTWAQLLGGSLFVSVGQTLLANVLKSTLNTDAPGVDAEAIINAGATAFRKVVSAQDLSGVIKAYNTAITDTFYLGVGAGALSIFAAFGMGFKKMAKKATVAKASDNTGVIAEVSAEKEPRTDDQPATDSTAIEQV